MYTDTVYVLKCTQTQSLCWNVHRHSLCVEMYTKHSLCAEMYTDTVYVFKCTETQSMYWSVYRHSCCGIYYRHTYFGMEDDGCHEVYVLKCTQTVYVQKCMHTVYVFKCTETQSMYWSVYRHSCCGIYYSHTYFGMEDDGCHEVYVLKCTETLSPWYVPQPHSLVHGRGEDEIVLRRRKFSTWEKDSSRAKPFLSHFQLSAGDSKNLSVVSAQLL